MKRIAIVEDEPLVAKSMQKLIQDYQDEQGVLFSCSCFSDRSEEIAQ